MSRAAEKEASEVLHSLLSVERIEKQEHTETFQTNGTNGETAEAETQIQWHTPVSIAGHNIFSSIDGATQFSQTIDNQQVIWEEHTMETEHHINSIYATTMQTTSADDDQLQESEPVKKKLKPASKLLVKKLKVIKKKKKFLPLEGSMEPTKLEESATQVKERFRRGCECQDESCFRGLNPDSVYKHRLNIAELTKGEHDMYLMGVTMACLANPDTTVRHKERRRLRSQYVYQGRRVCLDAFLYLENCTHYQLKRIRKHVMTHGVAPRVHGNHGKKPHNTFSLDIYRHATEFLKQYLEQHTNEANVSNSKQIIQLPWDITRKNVHDAYKEYGEVTDPGIKLMGYSTFRHFMKEQFPHVKFSKVELKNAAGQQHQQQQTLQQTPQTDSNQTTTIQIQQIPKQQLQTNVERPREQQLPKCIINQDVQQVIPLVVAPPHGDAGGGQHHQQATFLVTPVQQLLPNGNIVTATQTNNHATSNTFSYQLANTGYVINEHHTPYAFNRM
ncbi:uncharacterized protein [Onthophagus taurus]|uniref:uncharacterized protein n=1 Tax=Onthophagus taurus TaxID=166361 RepID=UPI000C208813|nr:uncharacterized protein LOC111414232 [Onthophagus taurus]